jgi:hypothetical protein
MGLVSGYVEIIAGTGSIIKSDMWGTINKNLHERAPELGKAIQDYVDELTPIRTGALIMDITFVTYPEDNKDIVLVYAENIAQQAFWNRIYVQYQEGGPLGEHTYTNDPHEMFFETARGAGLDFTNTWAEKVVLDSMDELL